MSEFPISDRNRVRRLPKRGSYDRAVVHTILDSEFLCHVAFDLDRHPIVIPTAYARDGDTLILHGSAASRMLRELSAGVRASISVAIVDGLVLARSAFHHSINYRSVVMFGLARLIEDPREKMEALERFMEHLTPGRWAETRIPSEKELKGTSVLRFTIEEASAKVRQGDPVDDEDDHSLEAWAGVVPMRRQVDASVPAADLAPGIEPSGSISEIASKWMSAR